MLLLDHIPVNIPTGSLPLGPALITDGLNSIKLRLARATTLTPLFWPNSATRIDASISISLDGGVSFQFLCGVGAVGGIHVFRGGTEAPETTLSTELPPGAGRQAKLDVVVTNGPLVSQVTLEAF